MIARRLCWWNLVCASSILTWSPSAVLAKSAGSAPIVLAWEASPRTIDPRFVTDANSHYLADLQHCSLINFDKDGRVVGNLAREWSWPNDKTLTLKLRDDAKFSDGTAVTAADVKATYDFFKKTDLKTASPLAATFNIVKEVRAPSPDTVEFHFSETDSSFLTNLVIGILPAKLAALEMFTEPTQYVGCGAFVLQKIDVSGLTLVANPKYSLGKAPQTQTLEIKIVKDELTRFAKLQKGEVDVVQNVVSRDKVEQIAKSYPGLKVVKRPGLNVTYIGFNMKDPLLKDANIRRAISMAIDRQAIIDYIFKGMAVPASTMLTPNDPYLNKVLPAQAFNPKGAADILDKAGYKDQNGKGRFKLTFKTTTDTTRINTAKAIASQLGKIGIKVEVQSLEWGKFKADIEKGQVQMWTLSWIGFKDPDIYRFAFASDNVPPNGGNRGWYVNSKLDDVLKKARATPDTKARQKLYAEVQEIVAGDMPYAFLWHEESFAVLNKNLKGYELFADGRLSSLVNARK